MGYDIIRPSGERIATDVWSVAIADQLNTFGPLFRLALDRIEEHTAKRRNTYGAHRYPRGIGFKPTRIEPRDMWEDEW